MRYKLIAEKGQYALILRGNDMNQYAVVNGLNKEAGDWCWTCAYYDFGKHSNLSKEMVLFKALDYFLDKTGVHISYERMNEIAGGLVSGLIEDGENEAYEYMFGILDFTEREAEHFSLDRSIYGSYFHEDVTSYPEEVEEYRTADHRYTPSSTNGDYGPSTPWNAPGMSVKDFI